ncbi:MAG: hypothetical protein WC828_05790 [Thermoleophilia bacterium]
MDSLRYDISLRRRVIALAILVVVLVIAGILLLIKMNEKREITGSSFSFLVSIYDLTSPMGVATDRDEQIYVSNTGKSEVNVYDMDGVLNRKLDDTVDEKGEPLRFYSPYGIAVDDARDKLYISDYSWGGVRVLTKEGEFLYNLPKNPADLPLDPSLGWSPFSVAVGEDRIYVSSKDGIYVFGLEGEFIAHWGTRGNEMGQYDYPNGVAVDRATGNLFVTDTINRRVVSLNSEGKLRWVLGVVDAGKGDASVFQLPRSVAIGNDGLVYVTDTFSHRIVVLDQDGTLVSMFGERGTDDAQFSFPEGLTISSSDRLYVADRQNNRLQIWQLAPPLPSVTPADVKRFGGALKKF